MPAHRTWRGLAKLATGALGIPDRAVFGEVSDLQPGQLYDLFAQTHHAERAGKHTDFRIGDPDTGLISWALPKGLPSPGEKRLAVRQPRHVHEYGSWQGEIPAGEYGAGTVETQRVGRVLVTQSSPDELRFTVSGRSPERFTMRRTDGGDWLMVGSTPVKPHGIEKLHMKSVSPDEVARIVASDPRAFVEPKVDGALTHIALGERPELMSPRQSKSGRPILYTEKVFGSRPAVDVPQDLRGRVLRGEVYGVRGGEVVPVGELSGILNMNLDKSVAVMRDRGIDLKVMLHGVEGVDDLDERDAVLSRAAALMPGKFTLPARASGGDALRMLRDIGSQRHPLTREGVVLYRPGQPPVKSPFTRERDVYITGFFPGQGRRADTVGGFEYSLEPGGQTAGRIGSGFSDELLEALADDPESFVGRKARVKYLEETRGGSLRAPRLVALHED